MKQYFEDCQILLQNSLYPIVLDKSRFIYHGLTIKAIKENLNESDPHG